jgi:metal-responsive CopG/Arc/MetJ family transcriptional regulator
MSPPDARKYDRQLTIHLTTALFQNLETLADRQRTSVGDLIRHAIREYLDVQEDLMGSRSRMGNRVARQLMDIQEGLLKRQARADTLLLAAIILLQMKQGMEGSKVLSQVVQLAAHARDEIHAVLEAET